MNTKFNLGTIEVKIPAGEDNPEINVAIKDISTEVTDMSLTEYAGVLKVIMSEATSAIKEFGKMQEESKQRDFERDQLRHEMNIQEINRKHELQIERIRKQAKPFDDEVGVTAVRSVGLHDIKGLDN